MRDHLLRFIEALRDQGVNVSLAEALDASAAAAVIGVERPRLHEALAAALVKDEALRPVFDALFAAYFSLLPADDGVRRRRREKGSGERTAEKRGRGGADGEVPHGKQERRWPRAPSWHAPTELRAGAAEEAGRAALVRSLPRHRSLLQMPFDQMTGIDVAEARALVAALGDKLKGRVRRRTRSAKRGRLDFRRTLRSAIGTGGVPLHPRWRQRQPGPPDVVALCDLSGSVAAASELCLGLLAPAATAFRRVQLFAYIDHLCPVSIEHGHVAPEGMLDLYARSDFGQVLHELHERGGSILTRSTVLLVAGDARNNRRAPRLDLWRAVTERVGLVVWLVPEPRARWDTGDSVLSLYAPACALVAECLQLTTLVQQLRRVLTR